MTFGEKLQKLRKEAGLSQEEFADQMGVSRQAVSKWERDSGYPETEKIIRMGRIFHVTLDYLLNEGEGQSEDLAEGKNEEKGMYVSRETADGFLAFRQRKSLRTGLAWGLISGGLCLSIWWTEPGMILYLVLMTVSVVLLFSVKLADNPYRRIEKEPLVFDEQVKADLNAAFSERKKTAYLLRLTGIVLIAAGILICPLITTWVPLVDDIIFAAGLAAAGVGIFLCIYMTGILRAYRLLMRQETE